MTTDRTGFDALMEEQRVRAREDRKKMGDLGWASEDLGLDKTIKTRFDGYDENKEQATVLAIVANGEVSGSASTGDKVTIVLDHTPFYAEMGGQVADYGTISSDKGMIVRITDVQKTKDGKFMHVGVVESGVIAVDDIVTAAIDVPRRQAIRRSHTATHLLQKALRMVLGTHVEQAGSYTDADHVRFDFTHFAAVTPEELAKIEEIVNDAIFECYPVVTEEMPIEEAKKRGAMALFGEKYGATVRVVQAGDFSIELCGGTHLTNTSQVGVFKIISESSVAAGVRRIEALTGKGVLKFLADRQALLADAAKTLKTTPNDLVMKIEQTVGELREMAKNNDKLSSKIANMQLVNLFNMTTDVKGVNVIAVKLEDTSMDTLRSMGDSIKERAPKMVAVLSTVTGDKINFLCVCGAEAVKAGAHAGKIVKEVAKICNGGGGGRPDNATAGGKDVSKLEEALEAVNNIVDAQLS